MNSPRNTRFEKIAESFSRLAAETVGGQAPQHVVWCDRPSFSLEIGTAIGQRLKDFDFDPSQWSPIEAIPVVGSAAVISFIDLMLDLVLARRGGAGSVSGSLVPTFRMLVAGPTQERLKSSILEQDCGHSIVKRIQTPVDGIRKVRQADYAVTLSVETGASNSGVNEAARLVKEFLRTKPKTRCFTYRPGETPKETDFN